jgi:CDP-diacylglycerol--serine O-phosphatidyltransferase
MLKTLCLADGTEWYGDLIKYALDAVLVVYALAALIRLAYFNVTEEERPLTEDGPRKYYVGLPVTSAALIVPAAAIIRFICSYFFDISFLFYAIMLVTAIAFVSSFKIKKFGIAGILVLIGIGAAICVTFLLFRFVFYANLIFF